MARLYKRKPKPGTGDLDVLHPHRTVLVAGEPWEVREYTLREGFGFGRVGRDVAKALGAKELPPPEFYRLLAVAIGKNTVRVAGLPQKDIDVLIAAWSELNAPWFEEDDPQVTQPNKRRPNSMRWGQVYTLLIARGHRREDIGNYTFRQVQLFVDEIHRLEHRERSARTADVNHGFAGGDGAKQYIRELQRYA